MYTLVAKTFVPRRYRPAIEKVYRQLLYLGNKVVCPCCKGHFRRFLPFGIVQRLNAQCPKCGSLERHRLLWLYFQHKTPLFSARLKVLHVAPEYVLHHALAARTNLDYVSADLSSRLAQMRMDITNIPCEAWSFDVILCSHVLEHVVDDKKAMGELFRVLKPGGWAILQSPIDMNLDNTFEDFHIVSPEAREKAFGQRDHVRIYGRDYKNRLEMAGFRVKVDKYAEEVGEGVRKKYGLPENEAIYFCTKLK